MNAGGRDLTVDLVEPAKALSVRLMLYVPAEPAPPTGWPILYLVDGNAVFATAKDVLRAQAPYSSSTGVEQGVIAAIGYPVEGPYDPLRRSWDLTPPPGSTYPPFAGTDIPVRTGGAEHFRETLEKVIKPWVEREVAVDPSRQSLFGHSFGGLFALYVLFTRPAMFDTYVAASPALSWEQEALRPFEETFPQPNGSPKRRLLLSAGEWEGFELAPFQRNAPDAEERLAQKRVTRTVAMAQDLAERLNSRHAEHITASYETFAKENHMSVLPVAVNRAVQATFAVRFRT